jgi:hypothetical protein
MCFGGRSTSAEMGSTPSGSGNEARRCDRKSADQERKVPSMLENVSELFQKLTGIKLFMHRRTIKLFIRERRT